MSVNTNICIYIHIYIHVPLHMYICMHLFVCRHVTYVYVRICFSWVILFPELAESRQVEALKSQGAKAWPRDWDEPRPVSGTYFSSAGGPYGNCINKVISGVF